MLFRETLQAERIIQNLNEKGHKNNNKINDA